MRIALVSPECEPLVKVGGLADVVASLPRALRKHGHEVEIYLPKFGVIESKHWRGAQHEGSVEIGEPGLPPRANLYRVVSRDVPIHLVGCPELYEAQPIPYGDYPDDPKRWAFFALAVLEAMKRPGARPDVIHCHDWPTGLLPVYRSLRNKDGPLGNVGIVFTFHNLAHPGKFGREWLGRVGLPEWLFDREQLEFHGDWSLLKAGLLWSTIVGTVSPTYAREVQGEALGCGMDGVLRRRAYDLVGVLNGIDTQVWDPARAERDPEGPEWPAYDEAHLEKRDAHRKALRARFGLEDSKGPLFSFVGILSSQRGLDALFDAIPALVKKAGQVAVFGRGESAYEDRIRAIAAKHPGQVGVSFGIDPILSKRIAAGTDFFVKPSKFEPCGLTPMIACRYGAIPIVSCTGGHLDTVRDFERDPGGYGITFPTPATMVDKEWLPAASTELGKALDRAFALFRDRARLDEVRRRAMLRDFSWDRSARQYEDVYADALRREGGMSGHYGP